MVKQRESAAPVTFSLVVPVRDRQAGLEALRQRVSAAADGLGEPCEIVFVDDGSQDGTAELIRQWHAEEERIKLVALSRPFGRGSAAAAGRDFATARAVISVESERAGSLNVIGDLAARWREGFEVVYTHRQAPRERLGFGGPFGRVLPWWIRVTAGASVAADLPDAHLLDRKVLTALRTARDRGIDVRDPVKGIGFRQASVPLAGGPAERDERSGEKPSGSAPGGGYGILAARLAAAAGAVLLAVAALYFLLSMLLWPFGAGPGPWGLLLMVVLAVSGVHLLLLGAVGEYVAARLSEPGSRPVYIVRETCGFEAAQVPPGRADRPPGAQRDGILIYT